MVGTRSNSWTNRPQGGGPKLSGLPNSLSSAGVGMMFGRTYVGGPPGLLANYKNKNQVFCINQMSGGVGAHGGGRSLFKMMDGLDCKGKKNIETVVGVGGGVKSVKVGVIGEGPSLQCTNPPKGTCNDDPYAPGAHCCPNFSCYTGPKKPGLMHGECVLITSIGDILIG